MGKIRHQLPWYIQPCSHKNHGWIKKINLLYFERIEQIFWESSQISNFQGIFFLGGKWWARSMLFSCIENVPNWQPIGIFSDLAVKSTILAKFFSTGPNFKKTFIYTTSRKKQSLTTMDFWFLTPTNVKKTTEHVNQTLWLFPRNAESPTIGIWLAENEVSWRLKLVWRFWHGNNDVFYVA